MLLEERASAVVPGFTLHPEDWESAAELCRRLDGNPLAIELAAARLRVLRIEKILQRLDSRFRLLTATSRVTPSRRQSMHAVIDGSFELCSESETTSPASADSGEETVVRRRHRDHYLSLVEQAESEWSGPRQPEWLARLRNEWPDRFP